jgi:glycerol kinase
MILGIDQGSSHTRAALFTHRGQKIAEGKAPLRTSYPQPGYVEHDPKAILKSTFTAIHNVVRQGDPKRIAAIGIANQRSTVLLWDGKTGEPLSPAISWQDRRTEDTLQKWADPSIKEKTGLPLSCHYSATKLSGLLDQIGRRRKNLVAGTVNAFLIWHLTKGKSHFTDPTHAQRMLLYNIVQQKWDDVLLRHFKIPKNILPEVLPNQGSFGEAVMDGCRIPITASIGDQQASLIGLGGLQTGAANLNYGTGGFFLIHTGPERLAIPGLLTSIAGSHANQTTYLIEGTVNTVGSLFAWLQRVGILTSVSEVDRAFRKSKAPILFLPALSGLAAPHWIGNARGIMFGLTGSTQKEDMVRGAVEGIAFQMSDIYQVVPDTIKRQIKAVVATGGGTHIASLIQFQADLFGKPISIADDPESTVRGAAFLAGAATGLTDETAFRFSAIRKKITPQMQPKERACLIEKWRKMLDINYPGQVTRVCDKEVGKS